MKVSTHDSISRYACVHGHQDDHTQKTKVSSSQLTRERKVARALSGIGNRATQAGQRHRVREIHRRRKRYAVTNAKVLGILVGNVLQDLKREPEHLNRQAEKTRPSVRNTRVRPETTSHGKIPDGKLRIREMGRRRKGRQLLSPRHLRKCCRGQSSSNVVRTQHSISNYRHRRSNKETHSGYGIQRVHIETRRVE